MHVMIPSPSTPRPTTNHQPRFPLCFLAEERKNNSNSEPSGLRLEYTLTVRKREESSKPKCLDMSSAASPSSLCFVLAPQRKRHHFGWIPCTGTGTLNRSRQCQLAHCTLYTCRTLYVDRPPSICQCPSPNNHQFIAPCLQPFARFPFFLFSAFLVSHTLSESLPLFFSPKLGRFCFPPVVWLVSLKHAGCGGDGLIYFRSRCSCNIKHCTHGQPTNTQHPADTKPTTHTDVQTMLSTVLSSIDSSIYLPFRIYRAVFSFLSLHIHIKILPPDATPVTHAPENPSSLIQS